MRIALITMLLLLVCCRGMLTAQTADEEPYDEFADSPTVAIEGCGRFPAVTVLVDGRATENRGFIRNRRTFLPARETLERLGGTVVWVPSERAFYARFPQRGRTIRVAAGSQTVQVFRYEANVQTGAGRRTGTITLNAAPFICDGATFAPVRAAVEAAGGSAHYVSARRTVYITSPARSAPAGGRSR